MSVEKLICEKLIKAFPDAEISVVNESHLHAGHAGSPGTGESHFALTIISDQFEGVGRVMRQRQINSLLKDAFAAGVHALALKTHTPEEAAALRD